jgi:large subunit ribosomal protein L1
MPRKSKRYQEAIAQVDRLTFYGPRDALELVKKTASAKFDETVEVHIRLGVDPRHSDQQVRGTVLLPQGLGKEVRVLVFADGEGAKLAEDSGADFVAADDEMLQKIQGGWTDFDVAIATPSMMGKVGRLGRILGPRGLMPNPKTNTVAPAEDLPRLIKEAKAGRVEYRLDRYANMHVPIGKASFTVDQLLENFGAMIEAVSKAKPATAKGVYFRKITLTSSMGPGIKVDAFQAQSIDLEI